MKWRQKFWRPSPQKLMKEEVRKWETRREKWRRRRWSRPSFRWVWRGWQDKDEDLESEIAELVDSSSEAEPWQRGQQEEDSDSEGSDGGQPNWFQTMSEEVMKRMGEQ